MILIARKNCAKKQKTKKITKRPYGQTENIMYINDDVIYLGVNDFETDLFEGQYKVPDGMAYNSYAVGGNGEKLAVFDTADKRFSQNWLENVKAACDKKGRTPDYLIIQHMEPDHSASIADFIKVYPETTVVGNKKTFVMIGEFFGSDFLNELNKLEVANGGELSLGTTVLKFVFAPMVHWPEVMFTYDQTHKILFSADAFGKFGAINDDEKQDDWACEARRYYFGIVGKYGAQVQSVLKQTAALDIKTICPLHGPVLTENLGYYLKLYDMWSAYKPETEGVFIAYTSVYGNTKKAALLLAEKLKQKGETVVLTDLARSDMSEAIEDAFRYSKLVLATTTYNGEVFPFMRTFIEELKERNFKNRTVGFIENGSWAPMAKKVMLAMLDGLKDILYTENSVTIRSALNDENVLSIENLACELAAKK